MNSRYALKKRNSRGEGVALPQVRPLEPERREGVRVLQLPAFRQMQELRGQGAARALTLWRMQSQAQEKLVPETEAKDVSPVSQDHNLAVRSAHRGGICRVQGHSNGLG